MSKRVSEILFVAILLSVAAYYNYHQIAFKRPQSTHKWRQSDCASLALNYYQGGMLFTQPKTHNLTSDNGTTGFNATSEIPILYYSAAVLYKMFGYHDYVYRIFNTLLFFLGLFYLFRIFEVFIQKPIWSIALTLLFFSSPLLVFYGNNFLSNSTALAFSIIGWYYFFQFYRTKNTKWYYISLVLFLMAASLKITALLSVFALSGAFILEWLGVPFKTNGKSIFNKKVHFLLPVFVLIAIPVFWILYAHSYNQAHDTTYFSTTIFPVWELNSDDISSVLDNIQNLWVAHYFHFSILIILPLLFGFWVFQYKKANKLIWWTTLITLTEILFYIALQFWTFADHDYYTINLYILPILLVIGLADWVKRNHPNWLESKLTLGIFTIFIVFNIQYTHQKMDERYNSWMNDYEQNEAIYSIAPVLRKVGIQPSDKVISIPDRSHTSLYLMNQPGWTEYTDAHYNRGEKTFYNQDREGILKSISNGAKYLIVYGIGQLHQKPYLQEFATQLVTDYHGVLIFDLAQNEPNFSLNEKKIKATYFCNSDSIADNGTFFITENAKFEGIKNRTNKEAFSGDYSIKINADSPYGMTLKLSNQIQGEQFKITFWRKAHKNTRSTLVISSQPKTFYHSKIKPIQKGANGWIQYQSQVTIPWYVQGQELKIFFYNPDEEPAYFDNLKVVRIESYLE